MTTIAYRSGVMACDTQVTHNDTADSRFHKVWRNRGVLAGASGSMSLVLRFRDWFLGGMKGSDPYRSSTGGNGLLVLPPGREFFPNGIKPPPSHNPEADGERAWMLLLCEWGPLPIYEPYYTMGSGGRLALSALAAGASAVKAVEIACRYDISSSGPVHCVTH